MSRKALREKYEKLELGWETAAAIGVVTGSKGIIERALKQEGGRINMCAAIEAWERDAREEGRQEGRQEGHQEGIWAKTIKAFRNAITRGQSIYVAADILDLSREQAEYLVNVIQENQVMSDLELALQLQKEAEGAHSGWNPVRL
jgi:flagellar biosynthesis/type III secretory pathway protein FliH